MRTQLSSKLPLLSRFLVVMSSLGPMALTACAADRGPDNGTLGSTIGSTIGAGVPDTAEQAQTVCDNGATTFGVDVSEFQGNIDWGTAHQNGVDFAVIRVGDGFYDDPKFTQNWNGAAAAGVLRGAYQFFRPARDPVAEANHFADVLMANGGPGELPPVIDVEVADGVDPGTYAAHVGTWLSIVEQRTGMRPSIYTGKYFWQSNVGTDAYNSYPLWIAQWGPSCPNLPDQWGTWTFWQTHDDGHIPGIPATVDTDVFNGTLDQLRAFRADPACLANPDMGGCAGSVVTACDSTMHVGTGDCGFFGATCSTEGGHPHCVHPYCSMNLNGAEDGTYCNGATLLDTCTLGQLTEGDCGFFGATCSEEGGQGHCVHPYCPMHLNGAEDGAFCNGDTLLDTCALGQLTEGDCGAYGAKCSDQGGQGHCVHFMCWTNLGGGEDGTFCKDEQTLSTCALGNYAETDCAAQGTTCNATAAGARCGAETAGEGEGEGASGGGGEGEGAPAGEGEGDIGGDGSGGEGEGDGGHVVVVPQPGSCANAGGTSPLAAGIVLLALARRRRPR